MAHHVVTLSLAVVADKTLLDLKLKIGDTISFISAHGLTEVEFDGAGILSKEKFTDGDLPVELQTAGRLFCRCRVKLPNGSIIGWGHTDTTHSGIGPEQVPSEQPQSPP